MVWMGIEDDVLVEAEKGRSDLAAVRAVYLLFGQ